MDDAVPVRVRQRAGDFGRDPERVGHRQLLLAGEPLPQRLALYVRHHVVQRRETRVPGRELARVSRLSTLDESAVEQRQDVRMLEVRRRADLGEEAIGADRRGELRPEHLERHQPVVAEVARQVDGRHAAGAELVLERVAVGERSREPPAGNGHAQWIVRVWNSQCYGPDPFATTSDAVRWPIPAIAPGGSIRRFTRP